MAEIIIRCVVALLVIVVALSFIFKYRGLLKNEAEKTKDTLIFIFALIKYSGIYY